MEGHLLDHDVIHVGLVDQLANYVARKIVFVVESLEPHVGLVQAREESKRECLLSRVAQLEIGDLRRSFDELNRH